MAGTATMAARQARPFVSSWGGLSAAVTATAEARAVNPTVVGMPPANPPISVCQSLQTPCCTMADGNW
ncbi:hypothetical protein KTQ42_05140|uniref:hypothetical protein n=1 Tax=Noviherbaspirillum sp. L7-7A TaxID=2850560 RepID=UPI001C2BACB2|nr:hypothetical protein [Noviherbaspirillum sp. L7-7A]MBV0878687.1 hypothetical protein [Noviherbaspirillum sp. L7-7A]